MPFIPRLQARVWRLPLLLLPLLLFVLGWTAIMGQQMLLWQRLPASAVERFVADRNPVPLPALPGTASLTQACAHAPAGLSRSFRTAQRADLAACLSAPDGVLQGVAAQSAITHYESQLARQMEAARRWLAEYDAQAPGWRAQLQAELVALRGAPGGLESPLGAAALRVARAMGFAAPADVRAPVGRPVVPDEAARMLRERVSASETRVQMLARSGMPAGERARELALMAAGLQLVTDYGTNPPRVHLATARGTLADVLEWQRRGHGYQQRGFDLGRLHALPATLLASATWLLLVSFALYRRHLVVVTSWVVVAQLLGLGALMLTDIALTGDAALRYLAERQFLTFAIGDVRLPLGCGLQLPAALGGSVAMLWWPLLAVAVGLSLLRVLRHGQTWLWAPLRAWVRWGDDVHGGAVQSALLLTAGAACVLLLGMPAAVSELLILLGCVGVASYLARQAPHANAGAGLQPRNLLVVGAALLLAVGGALVRGDLGHALLALMLAASFSWLFGWTWLRATWSALVTAALGALALCLAAGRLEGPMAWLVRVLPAHAQERFAAMFDPFSATSSDLARTHWLMDSAGASGWGLGYAPWQGLAEGRVQDGLPLQGPSDYVLALSVALWGQVGGVLLMAVVLAVFSLAAAIGLRTALRAAMPPAVRWLAALGGFGCMVMALKLLLSMGGVAGVLPLTGLPVALLGYGPVTHLAVLAYLLLALGTVHVVPAQAVRGASVRSVGLVGAVRLRGSGLAWAAGVVSTALLVQGYTLLRAGPAADAQRHVAQARMEMAQAISRSLLPASDLQVAGDDLRCPELANAVSAWNLRLVRTARPGGGANPGLPALRLDGARLLAAQPAVSQLACRDLARTLGRMLDTDVPRVLAGHAADYATGNAWWGRPGCLWPAEALSQHKSNAMPACDGQTTKAALLQEMTTSDAGLLRELFPRLQTALHTPAATAAINHRELPVGPAVGLTLEPRWQQQALRIAECFTGRQRGVDCDTVLPQDKDWRQRYFTDPASLRAGALGIVLAEVDSGRVVALAGAVSACTLEHLERAAVPDAAGNLPALRDSSACAQLPDRRSAWLAGQHPALWMVPPGSALKPLSLVAGIDAGLVAPVEDAYWKRILAESHERLPIQKIALGASQRYLDVLVGVGFGTAASDLLWGGTGTAEPPAGAPGARWSIPAYAGTTQLRATTMPLAQAEQMREKKQSGLDIDRLYGAAAVDEFLAARRLSDASVGGGDIRINALGLVDIWRQLDLRARGRGDAPAIHLLEQSGRAIPARPLGWVSPAAAKRVLGMTSGVAASAWKGTAQGACRVVFGACPAQGLPGLSGKTGSSDFLTREDGPWVKPGLQLPAKLFGGSFLARDGKRYAVAVMALRVRSAGSHTLELQSSAPAEAAFTLMRQMGMSAPGL